MNCECCPCHSLLKAQLSEMKAKETIVRVPELSKSAKYCWYWEVWKKLLLVLGSVRKNIAVRGAIILKKSILQKSALFTVPRADLL